jgi:L-amino acid N-acyltransferase YncA
VTSIGRPATTADAGAIAAIYNRHVTGTIVTFEEEPVAVDAMAARVTQGSASFPWLVWEDDGQVVGYAYGGAWRTRHAYRFAVETSIYVADSHHGRGIGRRLYDALLDDLGERGFHIALGCISLPNDASVALHEGCGFKKVGVFPAVGWKLGRWIDVGYWQRRLRDGAPAELTLR